MPDPTQLSHLRAGVHRWNQWRESQPDDRPQLDGLNPLDLEALGQSPDDAFDVWLDNVDMRDASLREAHFVDVSLVGSSFAGADLTRAVFTRCALQRADFSRALLRAATFQSCDMAGTRFHGATFGETLLIGLDLAGSLGLGEVVHRFDSVVDTTTLVRSAEAGQPRHSPDPGLAGFFNGCGVRGQPLLEALIHLGLPSVS